jgi:Cys-tRNA(Pro) deacylase
MTTRGIECLKEAGVRFEILPYCHEAKGAKPVAEALGMPEEIVIKSIVFRADDGSFLLALMGGDGTVSEKKLARASGHKRVSPTAPRDAERVTGYQIGGIGPFGLKQPLPVFLDETTAQHDEIVINAGARGTMIRLSTADLIRLTDATVADVRVEIARGQVMRG